MRHLTVIGWTLLTRGEFDLIPPHIKAEKQGRSQRNELFCHQQKVSTADPLSPSLEPQPSSTTWLQARLGSLTWETQQLGHRHHHILGYDTPSLSCLNHWGICSQPPKCKRRKTGAPWNRNPNEEHTKVLEGSWSEGPESRWPGKPWQSGTGLSERSSPQKKGIDRFTGVADLQKNPTEILLEGMEKTNNKYQEN